MKKAYALIMPETFEAPELVHFGFAETLAEKLLFWKGMERTADEIQATIEALQNPAINLWGCKLVPAEWKIVSEAAYTLDLEELKPYYEGTSSDEYEIRAWCATNLGKDHTIIHLLLDMLVDEDRDLDEAGLVEAIHHQIDMMD